MSNCIFKIVLYPIVLLNQRLKFLIFDFFIIWFLGHYGRSLQAIGVENWIEENIYSSKSFYFQHTKLHWIFSILGGCQRWRSARILLRLGQCMDRRSIMYTNTWKRRSSCGSMGQKVNFELNLTIIFQLLFLQVNY